MPTKSGIRKLIGLAVLSIAMCVFGFNLVMASVNDLNIELSANRPDVVPTPPPIVLLSPSSPGKVAGIKFKDEDILLYEPGGGTWSLYFDGSAVKIGKTDITDFELIEEGANGAMNVFSAASGATTASGNGAIIFGFSPVTLGENTTTGVLFGSFHPEIAGYLETVDGLFLIGGTNLPLARSVQGAIAGGINAAGVDSVEQYEVLTEVADESSATLDSYDNALDVLSAEEIRSTIYLPFVALQ